MHLKRVGDSGLKDEGLVIGEAEGYHVPLKVKDSGFRVQGVWLGETEGHNVYLQGR